MSDVATSKPELPPAAVQETTGKRWTPLKIALWAAIALLGGVAWVMLAIVRGETVNAIWFVFASVSTYLIFYRFYSKYIERKLVRPDDTRATPAEYKANGRDYVATDRRGCSATTSRPSPVPARSSAPCSPRRWATCRARSGSSSASSSPVRCRTTS